MIETTITLTDDTIEFLQWATRGPYGNTVIRAKPDKGGIIIQFRMTDTGANAENLRLDARSFYVMQEDVFGYDGEPPHQAYAIDSAALHETLNQLNTSKARKDVKVVLEFDASDGVRDGFDSNGRPKWSTPPRYKCIITRGSMFRKTLQCQQSVLGTSPMDFGERLEFDRHVLKAEFQSFGTQYGADKAQLVCYKDGNWIFLNGSFASMCIVHNRVTVENGAAAVDCVFSLDGHMINQIRSFSGGNKTLGEHSYWISMSDQTRPGGGAFGVAFEITTADGSKYLSVSGPSPETKIPNMATVLNMHSSTRFDVLPGDISEALEVAVSVCDKDNRPGVGVIEVGPDSLFVGGMGQSGSSEVIVPHVPLEVEYLAAGGRAGCGASLATLLAAFKALDGLGEEKVTVELKRQVGMDYPDKALVIKGKAATFFLSGNSMPGPYDCYRESNPLYNKVKDGNETS